MIAQKKYFFYCLLLAFCVSTCKRKLPNIAKVSPPIALPTIPATPLITPPSVTVDPLLAEVKSTKIPPKVEMTYVQAAKNITEAFDKGEFPTYKLWGPFSTLSDYCSLLVGEHTELKLQDKIKYRKRCEFPSAQRCGPAAATLVKLKSKFIEAKIVYLGGACALALHNKRGWYIDDSDEVPPLNGFLNNESRYRSLIYSINELESGMVLLKGSFIRFSHNYSSEKDDDPSYVYQAWYSCSDMLQICSIGDSLVPRCIVPYSTSFKEYCRDEHNLAKKLNRSDRADYSYSYKVNSNFVDIHFNRTEHKQLKLIFP